MTALIVVAEGTVHDTRVEEEHLDGRGTVRLATIDSPDQVREATRDAEAIVVTTNPLTQAHIAALGDGVRVIGRAGTGLDTIDLEAARARGLFVYHTPDYCTSEVATHALAMILPPTGDSSTPTAWLALPTRTGERWVLSRHSTS